MEEQEQIEQGFKFNYTEKENAVKQLKQEEIFKDLNIKIL